MLLIKGEKCKSVVRSTSKHIEVTVHYCRSVIGQFGSAVGVGEAELLPVVLERPVHPHVVGQVAVGQLPSEDHHVAHPLYCCVGMTGHLGTTQREIRESKGSTFTGKLVWIFPRGYKNRYIINKERSDGTQITTWCANSTESTTSKRSGIFLPCLSYRAASCGVSFAPGGLTDYAKKVCVYNILYKWSTVILRPTLWSCFARSFQTDSLNLLCFVKSCFIFGTLKTKTRLLCQKWRFMSLYRRPQGFWFNWYLKDNDQPDCELLNPLTGEWP